MNARAASALKIIDRCSVFVDDGNDVEINMERRVNNNMVCLGFESTVGTNHLGHFAIVSRTYGTIQRRDSHTYCHHQDVESASMPR